MLDFLDAINAAGIPYQGQIIADGVRKRIHVDGDRPGSLNGWYVVYPDEPISGAFGCWKRHVKGKWSLKDPNSFSPEEKAKFSARMAEAEKQREELAQKVHSECKKWCENIWEKAKNATDKHPYLVKKGVGSFGLKQLKDSLLIPIRDCIGNINGMQFITPEGDKKFKTGTAVNQRAIMTP